MVITNSVSIGKTIEVISSIWVCYLYSYNSSSNSLVPKLTIQDNKFDPAKLKPYSDLDSLW